MKFSKKTLEDVTHSRLNGLRFIISYLEENNVAGKKVADLSAGSGFVINLWAEAGATIEAYDLYPDVFKQSHLTCSKMDLMRPLPLLSGTYDYILLMETIEHIPDQFFLLQEIARILKPNGRLILTKPNSSSFSGRLANLWTEGERSNMYLPNEKTLIAYDNGNEYLGRFFLLGAQKLRSLAAKSGLVVEKIYPNQFSNASLVWGILLYPFLWVRSVLTRRKLTKNLPAASEEKKAINEQYQLNTNPTVLFHKHFCGVFKKVTE